MHKRMWLALSCLAAALLLLAIGSKTQAWTEFRSGNDATVAASETVDNSLWAGAKNVDIVGTVNGDLFCGGQTINISGTVKGDVICGGQTININGKVEGSVRLGAQTVNLNGDVGRSASIAAQTINTGLASRVAGDASLAGSDLNLSGKIGRDLAAAGRNVSLNGEVGRDIKGAIKQLSLNSSAKVGGGIDYTSKNVLSRSSGAQVLGQITQHQPKARTSHFVHLLFFGGAAAGFVALMLLVSALVVTAIFPVTVHRVSGQAMSRFWPTLLSGFAASILVPVLAVLLMVTVVGLPLGVLLLIGWLLVVLSSGLFSAYYLGRRLWMNQQNVLLRVLVGSIILLILLMLPFVGGIFLLLAVWLGAGMVLLELKTSLPKHNFKLK